MRTSSHNFQLSLHECNLWLLSIQPSVLEEKSCLYEDCCLTKTSLHVYFVPAKGREHIRYYISCIFVKVDIHLLCECVWEGERWRQRQRKTERLKLRWLENVWPPRSLTHQSMGEKFKTIQCYWNIIPLTPTFKKSYTFSILSQKRFCGEEKRKNKRGLGWYSQGILKIRWSIIPFISWTVCSAFLSRGDITQMTSGRLFVLSFKIPVLNKDEILEEVI